MSDINTQTSPCQLRPSKRLDGLRPYSAPAQSPLVDLALDSNEGVVLNSEITDALVGFDASSLNRYPSTQRFAQKIAEQFGIETERITITNGGDDAIDRICRAMLEPGRSLLIHTPTFEMIERGAQLAGAETRSVDWLAGPFPIDQFIQSITENTGLVALVTPNNPTGGVIAFRDILAIARSALLVGAVVLVDLAYIEFSDEDPTAAMLDEPNVVIVRTFSKAMGLAGARVGYAISSAEIAQWMKTVGGPYPVSSVSLALATATFELAEQSEQLSESIGTVRAERESLLALLTELGCKPIKSQGNFVLAAFQDAPFVHRALLTLGISVRMFSGRPQLDGYLRITLPGDSMGFERLTRALRTIIEPRAILFDLDGVLADVSRSYRSVVMQTANSFGIELSAQDIAEAKRAGDANNDWVLTRRLVMERGVLCELSEVIERFQKLYEGSSTEPGLRECEELIPDPDLIRRLADRYELAIVTGRPKAEAEWFLERAGLRELFSIMVCMEDAPSKPSPDPVLLAMDKLGVQQAWMIGDIPDDMVAARLAGVLPIGVVAPGDEETNTRIALADSGGAMVLSELSELEGIINDQ